MSDQKMQTVLVTGATGFTGGHLARTLSRQGVLVRALVRRGADCAGLMHENIELCEGDLCDRESVHRAAENAHTIYHVAAVYRSAKFPNSYFWDVNVGGTEHVLDAARKHGAARVVHCSTAGVHGEVAEVPADEDSPLNPGDIYQQTKLEGERLAARAFSSGPPGVIVRPVGIYGPGDVRFLKLFRAIARGNFRMFGDGDVLYHLTYIDDLIQGMITCAQSPRAMGQVYLLAGPRYTTINELAQRIARAVDRPLEGPHLPLRPLVAAAAVCEWVCRPLRIEPPLHRRRVDFFRKDRAFSIAKAQRELDFQPRIDLDEGLARTARWYAANGLLPRIADKQLRLASAGRLSAAEKQGA